MNRKGWLAGVIIVITGCAMGATGEFPFVVPSQRPLAPPIPEERVHIGVTPNAFAREPSNVDQIAPILDGIVR